MESHILTTEGVAMMFERLTKRGPFLEKMGVEVDESARRSTRPAPRCCAIAC